MTDRVEPAFEPVTYLLPQKRLRRLARAILRRSYGIHFWFTWAWFLLYIAVLLLFGTFSRELEHVTSGFARSIGWHPDTLLIALFVTMIIVFVGGLVVQRRFVHKEIERRVNAENEVQVRPIPGGMAFIARDIEHHVRWPSIHQIMVEPDGLAMVHGTLSFFVPSGAFAKPEAYARFRDMVIANVTPAALERSRKDIDRARKG